MRCMHEVHAYSHFAYTHATAVLRSRCSRTTERDAGGDTNLTLQGSETVARRSARSEDAPLEPVPDLLPRAPRGWHTRAHRLSLSAASAAQERFLTASGEHPEAAGCPSLTPPTKLDVRTTCPKRHGAATPPHRKKGRRGGGGATKRIVGERLLPFL